MRERVNVFYYPSMVAEPATLKKAILLFDELHFIDRPSFTFGNLGTIGTASPLRQYEQAFRDEGVPLYVHQPQDGPVTGEFLDQVKSDINDLEFLRRFQKGLHDSLTFRDHQIAHGNYGEAGSHEAVARALIEIDIESELAQFSTPETLLFDEKIQHFKLNTAAERTKNLVQTAMFCSATVNFALNVSQSRGITPLADSVVYQRLLGTKYQRAASEAGKSGPPIQVSDLSFAILDELIPSERIAEMTFQDVIKYRKKSAEAREAWLECLSAIHAKQSTILGNDYAETVTKIVANEVMPEARKFKIKMAEIHDNMFGTLATKTLAYLGGGGAAMQIFAGLSWGTLLHFAGLVGATGVAIGQAAIQAKMQERSAKRDCAISYILGLDS